MATCDIEQLATPPATDLHHDCVPTSDSLLEYASHILSTEAAALSHVAALYRVSPVARLGLKDAVHAIAKAQQAGGKLVVCGVGKSAYIAMKLVATCKSLGVPASFMHACEAVHGDLGDIRAVRVFPQPAEHRKLSGIAERCGPLRLVQWQVAGTAQRAFSRVRNDPDHGRDFPYGTWSLPFIRGSRLGDSPTGSYPRGGRGSLRRRRTHHLNHSRIGRRRHVGTYRRRPTTQDEDERGFLPQPPWWSHRAEPCGC